MINIITVLPKYLYRITIKKYINKIINNNYSKLIIWNMLKYLVILNKKLEFIKRKICKFLTFLKLMFLKRNDIIFVLNGKEIGEFNKVSFNNDTIMPLNYDFIVYKKKIDEITNIIIKEKIESLRDIIKTNECVKVSKVKLYNPILILKDGSKYLLNKTFVKENYFIVGNKLLDKKFIKWWLYKSFKKELNEEDSYKISSYDMNMDYIEINEKEYILINEKDYTILRN